MLLKFDFKNLFLVATGSVYRTRQLGPKCAITSEYQSTLDEEENGMFAGGDLNESSIPSHYCTFQSH